jgi:hypothetical protein
MYPPAGYRNRRRATAQNDVGQRGNTMAAHP